MRSNDRFFIEIYKGAPHKLCGAIKIKIVMFEDKPLQHN